ncbi:hypothetical protein KIL84_019041 [Mauremys mutica]|uniref:Uncharacterized protein n=1 Tax=Mauremys mutica TaxID=74926 RepID=A0A9D3XUJ4_9SAUR|nr:hypothetical protein KIL84_019041 [Mauremys mutica]
MKTTTPFVFVNSSAIFLWKISGALVIPKGNLRNLNGMCGNKMRTLTSGLDTAPFTWGTTREHWRYILESDVEVPVFIYSQRGCICKPAGMSKIDVLISRENLENKRRTEVKWRTVLPTSYLDHSAFAVEVISRKNSWTERLQGRRPERLSRKKPMEVAARTS